MTLIYHSDPVTSEEESQPKHHQSIKKILTFLLDSILVHLILLTKLLFYEKNSPSLIADEFSNICTTT